MGERKEHVPKIKKSKFNRQRGSADIKKNCGNDGYNFKIKNRLGAIISAGQCEIHHVLPVTSLQDGNIAFKNSEQIDFIHKCMAQTQWDINEQPNLIGLPTKEPYDRADRAVVDKGATSAALKLLSASDGEKGALPDLPCHLNAHPEYNQAIISSLNSNLWPEVLKGRAKCKDVGKDIRQLLVDHSETWKDVLKERGEEYGGAADCWVNRMKKRNVWFIPLSMDPGEPRKIVPPVNRYECTGTVQKWLKNIFNNVVVK
jgi:hypothetical protein